MILMECNGLISGIVQIFKNIVNIIWIVGPILAIIVLIVNFSMMMKDPDDKKGVSKIKNSIIALIILFFIPTFINITMNLLGESNSFSSCWNNSNNIVFGNSKYISPYSEQEKKSFFPHLEDYEPGVTDSNKNNSTDKSSNISSCGNLEYCNRYLTILYNNAKRFNDALVRSNSHIEFGVMKNISTWDQIISIAEKGEPVRTTCSRPSNWALTEIIGKHKLINSVTPGGFNHYSGQLTKYTKQYTFDGSMTVKTAIKKGMIVPGDIIGSYKHTFTIYSVNQSEGSAMVFDGGHRFTNKCQQHRKCSILFKYTSSTNSSLKLLQIIRWTK